MVRYAAGHAAQRSGGQGSQIGNEPSATLLALFASAELWSLMTNVVHYIILGAVFVLEYAYRRCRFRHHEHSGLFQFLRRLAGTRFRP
jgi:hypothetical protein